MNDYVANLCSAIAKNQVWRSYDIRTVAIQLLGEWHNLYSRAVLSFNSVQQAQTIQDEDLLPHLRLQHSRVPIDDLSSMLRGVEAGFLVAGDRRYSCVNVGNRLDQPASKYMAGSSYILITDHHVTPGGPWGGPEIPRWSMERLSFHGTRMSDLVRAAESDRDEMANQLRSLDEPFDGVTGLLGWFVGTNATLDHGCTVEILAPYEAEFVPNKSWYRNGEISVRLQSPSTELFTQLKIGVTSLGASSGGIRTSIRLEDKDWTEHNGMFSKHVVISAAGAERVAVLLSVGSRCIYRMQLDDTTVGQESPRLRAYGLIDPGYGELDERLFGGNSAGRPFEEAIARLFFLLGFSVDYLGGSKALSDGADFLAFADDMNLCVVGEVTSSSVDAKGKLGKLVARSRRAADELSNVMIVPIVVSSLERNHVSLADTESAGRDQIAVIAMAEVRELRGILGQHRALERAVAVLLDAVARGKVHAGGYAQTPF